MGQIISESLQPYEKRIKAGAELIKTMSSALYKNAYVVFEELISNSYDADATEVEIEMPKGELIIRDNGIGMDDEGLTNYLWLGYSSKNLERKTKRLRRNTIGKFGIGKLSMHVLCKECIIKTTKDGIEREVFLNFDDILNYQSLEEAPIRVIPRKSENKNGTEIRLKYLKQRLDHVYARRRILQTMPLNPDFKVILNREEIKPENVVSGEEYKFELPDSKLYGSVIGRLIYSHKALGQDAGIFIRVFGRTVNADDPNIFNLLNRISHAGSYLARLYGIIDADGLDNIILAHRNGFKEDDPKFIAFQEDVISEIRKFTNNIQNSQSKEQLEFANQELKDVVSNDLKQLLKGADIPEDFNAKVEKRPDADLISGEIQKIKRKQSEKTEKELKNIDPKARDLFKQISTKVDKKKFGTVAIGRNTFHFKIENMGKESKECIVDDKEHVIYINSDHPQFRLAIKEDSLKHHFRRVIVFELAGNFAGGSLSEFIRQYESMMRQEISIKGDRDILKS